MANFRKIHSLKQIFENFTLYRKFLIVSLFIENFLTFHFFAVNFMGSFSKILVFIGNFSKIKVFIRKFSKIIVFIGNFSKTKVFIGSFRKLLQKIFKNSLFGGSLENFTLYRKFSIISLFIFKHFTLSFFHSSFQKFHTFTWNFRKFFIEHFRKYNLLYIFENVTLYKKFSKISLLIGNFQKFNSF